MLAGCSTGSKTDESSTNPKATTKVKGVVIKKTTLQSNVVFT
ncbi:hypothetical protein [Alkalibaculum sporogenes]|nr:hypothetical protein [Alkalibaculum sporogenes]